MAGDDSGLGVCCQRNDPISGFPQDGAGLLTAQDALKRKPEQDGTITGSHNNNNGSI